MCAASDPTCERTEDGASADSACGGRVIFLILHTLLLLLLLLYFELQSHVVMTKAMTCKWEIPDPNGQILYSTPEFGD